MLEEPLVRRRFTREEFHRMGEAGIFTEDDRVELIEGEIVQMSPIGHPHAYSVMMLTNLLITRLGGRALLSPQNPVALSDDTEPLPDIVLIRPRPGYKETDITPADALLLIEVSDTSLRYDRRVKLRLYARAGIPEYWVVDVGGEAVEIHREPRGDRYERVERVGRGGRIAPEAFPDVVLAIDEIL
ncbi:MAG: Uma2 family endonuclease [Candidatus Rokubacteria bacterium]|nr:Uma2 family endonuclease [Candidatus Rokubacteria bacterium]MBI2493391.1 Uma2 family endonuclease [Candidatus Rokubacteria bacterium]MBI4255974.1 Uma2 family endonuclease [Candidatus Rokubacteria bacterium]MBI4627795.1 Uma2 family endonuclease [Candidatus Rokubacteria bacterium]